MSDTHQMRWARALLALEGLSVGDALGQRFFGRGAHASSLIAHREVPPPRWNYTDGPLHCRHPSGTPDH
jgi:hypothetical protein